MNAKQALQIKLEKVIGTKPQIVALFQFLRRREYNISNSLLPTFYSHSKFVKNHPYRAWYLIKLNNLYIGSSYVMESNCIGISLSDNYSVLPLVYELISKKHKPLKEIKSVRPSYFFINIAPKNKKLEHQLIKIGATKIQTTYSLESIIKTKANNVKN